MAAVIESDDADDLLNMLCHEHAQRQRGCDNPNSEEQDEGDELVNQLCAEHVSLSSDTATADGLRASSDTESEAAERDCYQTIWWVKLLKQHLPLVPDGGVQDLASGSSPSSWPRHPSLRDLKRLRLKVMSGCTGISAESAVLKARLSDCIFEQAASLKFSILQ